MTRELTSLDSGAAPSRSFQPGHMIRILIADDHAIVRAGLKQFIADQLDMEVTGEAATGAETIALVRSQEFDIVLLDISMPDKNGIDTLKSIKQIRPDLPVLILSGHAEEQYAVNLLRAGASGYLNKETASTQLVGAVRTAVPGIDISRSLRAKAAAVIQL